MKRSLTLLILASAVLLVGCDHSHQGQHCTHSHTETVNIQGACEIYQKIGTTSICTYYQQIPVPENVCDTWAPNDPSTIKPTDIGGN